MPSLDASAAELMAGKATKSSSCKQGDAAPATESFSSSASFKKLGCNIGVFARWGEMAIYSCISR